MEVSYIRKNGKRLNVRKHVGKRLDHFTVTQGSCADDKHIYIAFERKPKKRRSHAIKIVRMNIETFKVEKVSNALKIGHANDMCIKDGILYITHSSGSSVIHRVDAKTLKKKKGITVGNAHYNGIACYGSGFILRVMGGNKLLIVNKRFHKVRTIHKEKEYKTSQGMTQKGGKIYIAYSHAQSDRNYVCEFNKNGNLIKRRKVPVYGELESCFLHDGQLWFTIYRKKKVNGKMKYMAYIAKEKP